MGYLQSIEFIKIIEESLKIKQSQIKYFFNAKYLEHKNDNGDFVDRLGEYIYKLDALFEDAIGEFSAFRSDIELKNRGIIETDFSSFAEWGKRKFYFYSNGTISHRHPKITEDIPEISPLLITGIKSGFENFKVGVDGLENTSSEDFGFPSNKDIQMYFVETYNKEVTAERKKELEDKLNGIERPVDKLNFLKEEKKRYLQNISAETLISSGQVSSKSFGKETELFFDRYIQIEIDHVINALKEELNQPEVTSNKKLQWIGSPSQFGFIIDLLIQKGYLKKPTSSFTKDAEFYSTLFDIETTLGTLAKVDITDQTLPLISEHSLPVFQSKVYHLPVGLNKVFQSKVYHLWVSIA